MPPKPKTGTAEVLKKIKKCQNLKHVSNTLKFNSFSTKLTPKMRNKSSNDQIESFPLTKVQLTRKQNSAPNLLSCYPEALSSSTLTKFQSTSKASTINTRSTKRTKTDSGCSSDHDDRDDLSKPLRLKMDKHEKLEKLKLESKLPLSPLLRTEPRKLNTDPKSKEITDKEKRIERKGDKNDIPFQEFHKMNPHREYRSKRELRDGTLMMTVFDEDRSRTNYRYREREDRSGRYYDDDESYVQKIGMHKTADP